jgi:hypothetical protein
MESKISFTRDSGVSKRSDTARKSMASDPESGSNFQRKTVLGFRLKNLGEDRKTGNSAAKQAAEKRPCPVILSEAKNHSSI